MLIQKFYSCLGVIVENRYLYLQNEDALINFTNGLTITNARWNSSMLNMSQNSSQRTKFITTRECG